MKDITVDPEILGGIPVFTGTRVPVQNLFDYLEAGESVAEFIENFPDVAHEQAIAACSHWTKFRWIFSQGRQS